jgi:hypothetical protein
LEASSISSIGGFNIFTIFVTDRFGRGYQLKVKCSTDPLTIDGVKQFAVKTFEGAVLKEECNGELTFQVRLIPRHDSYG